MPDVWTLLAALALWGMGFYTVTQTAIAVADVIRDHAPSRHLRLREKYRALSQVFDFAPKDTTDATVLGKFEYHRRWLERQADPDASLDPAQALATDQPTTDACGRGVCALGQGHGGVCRQ